MDVKIKNASGKTYVAHNIKKGVTDEELLRFLRDLNSLGWSIAGFWNERGNFIEVIPCVNS